MKVTSVKTHRITTKDQDILAILDRYIYTLKERSILVVASKIVSICEGSVVPIGKIAKERLVEQEADYFLPKQKSKYGITLTVKGNTLIPSAGIDESNGRGYYVLWPKDPQRSADRIREYLCKRFLRKHVGVVITDSKTTPLRWGTTGVAIAHSGFEALRDYIGKPDIFGRKITVTKTAVADGLAAAAVLAMGEGAEQTPLAVIEEVPFVKFQARNPTKKELEDLHIELEDDLYAPLLENAGWKPRKK
ncbi:coenzyme F420-0:L-glutamate ligase [Candidatus Roizmanbacteria bacterium]|nr:coenzyme F420-0:L-glutamate ligase [Candidatus Roizmanbacteria bacterium]